jgi:hypothetical protein
MRGSGSVLGGQLIGHGLFEAVMITTDGQRILSRGLTGPKLEISEPRTKTSTTETAYPLAALRLTMSQLVKLSLSSTNS